MPKQEKEEPQPLRRPLEGLRLMLERQAGAESCRELLMNWDLAGGQCRAMETVQAGTCHEHFGTKLATFFIALANDNQLGRHDPEALQEAKAKPKKGSVQCSILPGPSPLYCTLILREVINSLREGPLSFFSYF